MKSILEAKRMNKVYAISKDNTQQVLRDVDISIGEGEFVSVMGPSGSGKSTLLYNISGMDKVTTGSIRFCGSELTAMPEDELAALRLRKMGFVFQQSNLLKNLNILDNIILSAFMSKSESRAAVVNRAKKLMEQTGISELADNDITQASGGQLQRVAICRALINNPDIVFGDEPTGALNSKATGEVMDILAEINRAGTTIMLVTHDAKVAAKTERVLFMVDGRLAGEKRLGKYQGGDIRAREGQLTEWLTAMGFNVPKREKGDALMKRTLMQIYVTRSDEAITFYQKAFDAPVVASYPNDDGTFMHAELDIQGQILALSERNSGKETITGNTMQFCLHYGENNEDMVKKAYDVLKEDAEILTQLAPCDFSPLMTDLIDKYGIRWCLFV